MARGFNHGLYRSNPAPEDFSGVFYSNSRKQPPPALASLPAQEPGLPPSIPSAQQLGGMLNGLFGNVFENNNWWLWAALLFIFFNPDLRKKFLVREKEADQNP